MGRMNAGTVARLGMSGGPQKDALHRGPEARSSAESGSAYDRLLLLVRLRASRHPEARPVAMAMRQGPRRAAGLRLRHP